jgi:hypothetical protein
MHVIIDSILYPKPQMSGCSILLTYTKKEGGSVTLSVRCGVYCSESCLLRAQAGREQCPPSSGQRASVVEDDIQQRAVNFQLS